MSVYNRPWRHPAAGDHRVFFQASGENGGDRGEYETVARLQRFYGGDPERWLDTRFGLTEALCKWLPRLQAEETMLEIRTVMLATGHMKEEHANEFLRDLGRIANPQAAPVETKPDLASVQLAMMALGLEVLVK